MYYILVQNVLDLLQLLYDLNQILYNILLKYSPIVSMGEILTVQFNTFLYESELEASLECTWNTLYLCHTGCVPKVRLQFICRVSLESLLKYYYGL